MDITGKSLRKLNALDQFLFLPRECLYGYGRWPLDVHEYGCYMSSLPGARTQPECGIGLDCVDGAGFVLMLET